MSYITLASNILKDEAKAIFDLIEHLDTAFDDALHLIDNSEGRIIVTGMGKSGHIAKKVSATLASTGTPSSFLHPAEGIHGDLGMITSNDVVLAFSNSGETIEILNLLPSIKRIGSSVISVVGNTESTLAKLSDVVLYAGVEKEADPLNLAPTSSTTAALALGDALAMCLLSIHRFTAEQFAIYHPGGTLGKKLLLTVKDVMHRENENPVVFIGDSVTKALFTMTDKGLGAVTVVNTGGYLKGLITDGDIRRGLEKKKEFLSLRVEDVMTKCPKCIEENQLAAYALHLMEKHKPKPITVLPVVDGNNKIAGMIHITDLLKCGLV